MLIMQVLLNVSIFISFNKRTIYESLALGVSRYVTHLLTWTAEVLRVVK